MSVYEQVEGHARTIESMNAESYMTPNSGVGVFILLNIVWSHETSFLENPYLQHD